VPEVAAKQRAQKDQVLGAQGSVEAEVAPDGGDQIRRCVDAEKNPRRVTGDQPDQKEDRQRYSKDDGNKQDGPSQQKRTHSHP
jgi:hypothetical protein